LTLTPKRITFPAVNDKSHKNKGENMNRIIYIGVVFLIFSTALFAQKKGKMQVPNDDPNEVTKELAYQESFDGVLGDYYKYIAYSIRDKKSGELKEVRIKGYNTGGTVLKNKSCPTLMRYRKNNKKDYYVYGFDGLSEKNTKDNRVIEHRIYCNKKTGKPLKVEMILQTRAADGSANERIVSEFKWPADK
jgi:hypothetical protein